MEHEPYGACPARSAGGAFPSSAATTALLLVAVALLPLVACGCKDKPAAPGSMAANEQVAKEHQAMRASFLAEHELTGRVALVEFGTLGCKLSEQGLDEMAFLHGTDAIPQLAYARVEASKDAAAVEKYFKAKSLKFPVHRDPETKLAQAFDATCYPSFVIVGKFGRVRYRGSWPEKQLGEWAAALLAEKTDPGPGVAMLGAVTLDGTKLLAETKLPDMAGREATLDALSAPGGLLLLFVDTTCPYSAQAMADMPVVADTLSRQNVHSVAVSIEGTKEAVEGRFGKGPPGVPLLYDATSGTKEAWNVQSVPTVAYISPGKQVAYYGKALWSDVAKAIETARGMKAGTIRFTTRGTRFG